MCLVSMEGFGAIEGRGASAFQGAEVLNKWRGPLRNNCRLHWRHVKDRRGMAIVLCSYWAFFRGELAAFPIDESQERAHIIHRSLLTRLKL